MGFPADLEPSRIARVLRTERLGRSLDVRATTGSTNDDARAAAEAGAPDGHVVLADAQTRGRGSHGRAWSSPGGTDLYLSVVVRPSMPSGWLPVITLATGLAVSESVEQLTGLGSQVKWPNDVWLDAKKCAGILVESTTVGARLGAVVIGIGLDVNRAHFEPAIDAEATSLARRTGRTFDRAAVLGALLGQLESRLDTLGQHGPERIVDALSARLALRAVRVTCGEHTGELVGLAPDGALLITTSTGAQRVIAGTLRRVS